MHFDPEGKLVQVYVETDQANPSLLEGLQNLGVTVQIVSDDRRTVQALAPVEKLDSIAGLAGVSDVGLPDYGFVQSGSATSQGDAYIKADWVRQYLGVTGAGVRVGVISDGVAGLEQAEATGDLPPRWTSRPATL